MIDSAEVLPNQAESILHAAAGQDVPLEFRDRSPRIVFLSASDGTSAARVVIGTGVGLEQAARDALDRLSRGGGDKPRRWLKLDVVRHAAPLGRLPLREPLDWEKGVDGLAFDAASGVALIPEVVVAGRVVSDQKRVVPERLREAWQKYYSTQPPAIAPDSEFYRFSTDSYFFDGKKVTKLYRGHRVVESVSNEELLAAATLAGNYLTRNVGPDGKFIYQYFPELAKQPDDYNIVRHAGTVYAMMELYGVTRDPALLAAGERAIEFLHTTSFKPWSVAGEDVLVCVDVDGDIKLGGNALAVVALCKHAEVTGDRRHLEAARKLTRWMQLTQAPSGRFTIHQQKYPEGRISTFESNYYPGEALLALNRLYALDPDESYLDSAVRGARHVITVRYGGMSDRELPHDHWMLYALNDLHRRRPDEVFLAYVQRLVRIIAAQQIRRPLWPDWLGGWYHPPRANPTSTRCEGLGAAYQLLRDFGEPAQAQQAQETMELAMRFLVPLQFGPESVMYFDDPQRALGGIREGPVSYEIRIDTVQHNISAILGLLRVRMPAPATNAATTTTTPATTTPTSPPR